MTNRYEPLTFPTDDLLTQAMAAYASDLVHELPTADAVARRLSDLFSEPMASARRVARNAWADEFGACENCGALAHDGDGLGIDVDGVVMVDEGDDRRAYQALRCMDGCR